MVSVYSVISSVLFYNLGLVIIFALRRKREFMARYAISTLIFLAVLSIIRLLFPIDFPTAYVIRSESIIPGIINVFSKELPVLEIGLGKLLLVVWAVGTLFYFVKDARCELKAYNARKKYPRINSAQVQRILSLFDKDYTVVVSPKVSEPYTVGLFRPIIYLPYIKLNDEELRFVLLHEVQHIRSHDNLKRLLFLVIEALFWWNPLAHLSLNEFEMLIEMQCDAKVAASMDSGSVKQYLSAILTVIKQLNPSNAPGKTKLATSFAQTYSIKQRFEVLLLRKTRKPKHVQYLVCCAMAAIFILSYFVIIQAYYPMPTVAQGDELGFSGDDSFILIDGGTPYLIWEGMVVEDLTWQDLSNPPYNNLEIIGG